ncbi:hypothetical protein BH24DEI2_BH24DEI2_19380 [soil metagenome]
MKTVSVTAHFDGEHIRLDEPLDLEPNTKLMVTVLSGREDERSAWQRLSSKSLARAYSDDEEEYAPSDVKVGNPDYERR